MVTFSMSSKRGANVAALLRRATCGAAAAQIQAPPAARIFSPPSLLLFTLLFASFPISSISSKCARMRRALLPPPSFLSSFPPSFPPSFSPSPSLSLPLPPSPSLFFLFGICRARCARPLRLSHELRSHCTRMHSNGAPGGAQSLSLPSLLSSSFLLFSSFPLFLTLHLQGSLRSPCRICRSLRSRHVALTH